MPANRTAALERREILGGDYHLLTFHHPEVAREARAGQFVMLKAGVSAEPPLRRPFSILATEPSEDTFTLFIKAVGQGSRALSSLALGDLALCLGPQGRPFSPPPAGTEALLVAGGYGVAPFHLFCRQNARPPARVFYGGRTAADLPLRSLLSTLEDVAVEVATEDGTAGVAGLVTVPLLAYLDSIHHPVKLYACGPSALMYAVACIASERHLDAEVSLDPWMGCGLGTCLGCVVPVQLPGEARPKQRCACTEGPVFDAGTVVWPGEEASRAARSVGTSEGVRS